MQKVASDIPDSASAAATVKPSDIENYAGSCISYVHRALGVSLDSTVETLPLLDHYLANARHDIPLRPEAMDMLAVAAGAYLGELIRNRHHGVWVTPGDDPLGWNLQLVQGKLTVYPFAISLIALQADTSDKAPAVFEIDATYRKLVSAHLANLPPVPEDQYLTPSVRVEVIDIIVDQITGQMARTAQ